MRKSRSLFTDAKPRRTGALVYPMLLILLLAVIVALNFVNNGRVKLLNEDVTITSLSKDLEKFRKNNSVDLGYIRADLEEPEDHEPTQAIPTAAIQAARKERTPAEEKKRDKKLIAIVVGGFAAALLVVFLLFKFVFGGINDNPAAQSYKVPDVLGKTVEEAQQMEGVKGVFHNEVAVTKKKNNYRGGRQQGRQQLSARPDHRAGPQVRPCPQE